MRGSFVIMSFVENHTHTVVMMNITTKGINGRMASMNGRIFPVRFWYDLQTAVVHLRIVISELVYLHENAIDNERVASHKATDV